jgi:predicted amidohydrolase
MRVDKPQQGALTTIATCAFPPRAEVGESLRMHLAYIDEAAEQGADLIVFPEISVHGYPPDFPESEVASILERVYRVAEPVPAGNSVRAIEARAIERGIHVIFGLHEAGDRRGIVYNTAVLTGPAGYLGSYRKMHVGMVERLIWRLGHEWPVFETSFGRVGMLICWDKTFPESTRELTLRGADLLVMPTAWGRPPGSSSGYDNPSVRLYDIYDRARAAENGRWFVSSNFVGEGGGREYIGMSQIVDPLGAVIATTGTSAPGLAVATVDIEGGIAAAYAAWEGPYLIRDRRPESYGAIRGEVPTVVDG